MANRGGFKSSTTLRPEQMQGMGINAKEMQSATITQPPTYPTLINRPIMPEITPEREFVINWKENFQVYLRNSPYYTDAHVSDSKYYQRYYLESTQSYRKFGCFSWSHMPAELKPNFKRKHAEKSVAMKTKKLVNVEETLKALEQKESSRKKKQQTTKDENNRDSDEEKENVEDEEHDNEMDEDNDYLDNYFDGGDDYNEEDDNLEDGPIY